jgi:hypothetical protein
MIAAGAAPQRVATPPADEPIVAVSTGHAIPSGTGSNLVVAAPDFDPLGGPTSCHRVVERSGRKGLDPVDHIGAQSGDDSKAEVGGDRTGRCSEIEVVLLVPEAGTSAPIDAIVAWTRAERVAAAGAAEDVVAATAVENVGTISAVQDVGPFATVESVVAVSPFEPVRCIAAGEQVGSITSAQHVAAASTVDLVAAGERDDDVRPGRSPDDVVAVGS